MGEHRAILAAKEGDLTTLRQLHVDGTLGQNITDCLGAGLVHHASRAGRLECIKFLVLQAKLRGNQRANNGATPAHDAAAMGNLAELQWLIKDGGYSKQERDASGASPLHLAARFGHSEVVEWLVQAGYDTATETREGAVPAHYAAVRGDLTCLKLLVAADWSCVNKQTQSGATPLYLASQEGHLHIVQFLAKDCRADVHLRAHDGMTVLHAATCGGHYAVVVWLVTFTDISLAAQDEEGATALHFAARGGHAAIVDRLLLMGAEVVLDYWAGTPLHDAAKNGHLKCCQMLLSHQVDPRACDGDGYTAWELAEYNGHRQCARYLQEAEHLVDQQCGCNNQEAQIAKLIEKRTQATCKHHIPAVGQDGLQILSDDTTTSMENGQTQQPMRPLQVNVSHTSGMQKGEINSTLQKAPTSKNFNMVKPTAFNKSLITELKINKSLQAARITALLANSSEKTEPSDTMVPRNLLSMLDEVGTSDIDALVPTHDERGCPIPEWKRQVIVRKLQAQLACEGGVEKKNKGGYAVEMDDWQYSQAYNAILGPYGELLTEDDLLYLEKQIEKLQMKRKCQEYQSELGRLTEELQTVLPPSVINITVNRQLLPQGSEDEAQELPAWCSHMSGVVKSMSLLLTNINGMKKGEGLDQPASKVLHKASQSKECSGGTAKREILECGVSVRNLRGNFEKRVLLGQCKPFELQGLKAVPWECKTDGETTPQMIPCICKGKKQLAYEEREFGDLENASDSGISCGEASSDVSGSISTLESSTLRKERIVLLFLSHWKKSAYTPSLRFMARKTLDAHQPGKLRLAEVLSEAKKQQAPTQKSSEEISKLGHLVQQRYIIKNLIAHWKDIISLAPSRQTRHLSHQHAISSPEQFLPYVHGKPIDYNALTLDLFMLGYFHILELDLSPEERKTRHLLCFEVFDHLGRHPWEIVRAFHKAVINEIAAGKRGWRDGFEDIKARFFGKNKDTAKNVEFKRAPMGTSLKPVPQARAQSMVLEQGQHVPDCLELGSFSNDEICKYIERSFAFWKEKEAEIFRMEESRPLC